MPDQAKAPNKYSFLRDILIVWVSAPLKFLKSIVEITTSPTWYAHHRLHLDDRTNFIKHARLYIEGSAYTILLLAISAKVSEQWLLRSEIRFWAFSIVLTIAYALILVPMSRVFIGKVSFQNLLLAFFPIAVTVVFVQALFRLIFRTTLSVLDYTFDVTTTVATAPTDPHFHGLYSCLTETLWLIGFVFGAPSQFDNAPTLPGTLIEGGAIGYIVGLTSAIGILSVKFGISKARAAAFTLMTIVAILTVVGAMTFVGMLALLLSTGCGTL